MNFDNLIPEQPDNKDWNPVAVKNVADQVSSNTGVDPTEVEIDLLSKGRDSVEYNKALTVSRDAKKQAIASSANEFITNPDFSEEEKISALKARSNEEPSVTQDYQDMIRSLMSGVDSEYDEIRTIETNEKELTGSSSKKYWSSKEETVKSYVNEEYLKHKSYTGNEYSDTEIKGLTGIAGMIAPTFIAEWVMANNHMFPDHQIELNVEGVLDTLFVGRIQQRFEDKFLSLKTEEERFKFVQETTKYMKDKSFFTTGIDQISPMALMTDISEEYITGETDGVSNFINSLTSAIEATTITGLLVSAGLVVGGAASLGTAAVVGGTAYGASRLLRYLRGFRSMSKADLLAKNNPKVLDEVAAAANSSKDALKSIDIEDPDLLNIMLGDIDTRIPDQFVKNLTNIQTKLDEMRRIDTVNTHLFQPDELTRGEEVLKRVLSKRYPSSLNSKVDIDEEGLNWNWSIKLGKGEDHGFTTLGEAVTSSERFLKKSRKNIDYFVVDVNGEYKKVTNFDDLEKSGEFFYELKGETKVTDVFKNIRNRGFTANAVKDISDVYIAESLYDTNAMFSRPVARAINTIEHRSASMASELRKLFDPFTKSSQKDQNHIVRELSQLLDDGGDFTYKWIVDNNNLSPSNKKAAFAYKSTLDSLHYFANDKLYRKLLDQNYKTFQIDDELTTIAREKSFDNIKSEMVDNKLYYFDTTTKKVETMDILQLSELYSNGGSVMFSYQKLGEAGNLSNFIIKTPKSNISVLPYQVLNYTNKYITPLINNNTVYVKEIKTIKLNGKTHTYEQAVAGAEDLIQGEQIIKDLQKQHPDSQYKSVLARELNDTSELDEEVMRSTGSLFYNKRGERIKTVDGSLGLIKDPVESLITGIDRISHKYIADDVIQELESTFVNSYPQFTDKGMYPKTREGLNKEATVLWNKIERLKRADEGAATRILREKILKVAKGLTDGYSDTPLDYPIRWFQRELINASQIDPYRVMKSLAFNLSIRGNPTRQLPLQAQQFLMMMPLLVSTKSKTLGIAPITKVMTTTSGLILRAVLGKAFPIESIAKDWKQLSKSGYLKTVDQHMHVDSRLSSGISTRTTLTGGTKEGLQGVANLPLNLMGKGFMGGEAVNRIGSWVIAKERYFLQHGFYPTNHRQWQEVNAEADSISLSMHRDSGYVWQKGALGVMLQYTPIQLKAAMSWLPKYGSKAFTGAEKFRIFIGQALFHGLQGFGLSDFVDNMFNVYNITSALSDDEKEQQAYKVALMGGLTDFMFYKMTKEHLNVSESIAAGGSLSTTMYDKFAAVMGENGKNIFDIIPAAQSTSKLWKTWKQMQMIWGYEYGKLEHKSDITPTEMYKIVEPLKDVLSGMNNYTKMKAHDLLGQGLVTSSGVPTGIELTPLALDLKKWFGVMSQKEKDRWRLMKAKGLTDKGYGVLVAKDIASTMGKEYIKYLSLYSDDLSKDRFNKPDLYQTMLDKFYKLNTAIMAIHGDDASSKDIIAAAQNYVKARKPKLFDKLVDGAFNDLIASHEGGKDRETMISLLLNTLDSMPPERQKTLRPLLEAMYDSEFGDKK